MARRQIEIFGITQQLSIDAQPARRSLLLGGVAEGPRAFNCVLTDGAARMLWFHLTRHLYPEQSRTVTALVTTAALSPVDQPNITTYISVERDADDLLSITGDGETGSWAIQLIDLDARRLWAQLDLLLHPVGWKGRESRGH